MQESAWRRAIKDTYRAQKTVYFMWGGESVLAVAGGAWLTAIAPANANTGELVLRSIGGGLGGLIVAVFIIFSWQLFQAPYKQRNEARERINEIESSLNKPRLVDIVCRTSWISLPINILANGSVKSSGIGVCPAPLQLLHLGELTEIRRFTMTPKIYFTRDDGSWETTAAITLQPDTNPLASSRVRNLSWDATDVNQWVLNGLPLSLAKDESLVLPQIKLLIADGNEVTSHWDKEEKCVLRMSFGIFTDKGSPQLPTQEIDLRKSGMKINIFPISENDIKQ